MIKDINRTDKEDIKKYKEINLDDVVREYLMIKGTYTRDMHNSNKVYETNKIVSVKKDDFVNTALFVYDLKQNPTNKRNCAFYLEKIARLRGIIHKDIITVPIEIWEEVNEYLKRTIPFLKTAEWCKDEK